MKRVMNDITQRNEPMTTRKDIYLTETVRAAG